MGLTCWLVELTGFLGGNTDVANGPGDVIPLPLDTEMTLLELKVLIASQLEIDPELLQLRRVRETKPSALFGHQGLMLGTAGYAEGGSIIIERVSYSDLPHPLDFLFLLGFTPSMRRWRPSLPPCFPLPSYNHGSVFLSGASWGCSPPDTTAFLETPSPSPVFSF